MFDLFESLALDAAREQFVDIARDAMRGLRPEWKAKALSWIELVLERWKRQQAGPDGTVEIELPITGPLGMGGRGQTLRNISSGNTRRRVSVSKLKPWECAGLGIGCDADLYARLAYGERYEPITKIEEQLRDGVALALLLERDAATMPVHSLAYAVRYLWIGLFEVTKAYHSEFQALSRVRAKQVEDRAKKNAEAAASKSRHAAFAHAEWKRLATNIWLEDITQTAGLVASKVVFQLPKPEKGRKPSVRTVKDLLIAEKVRDAVKAEMQRVKQRKQAP